MSNWKEQALQLFMAGTSKREISRKLDVPYSSLWEWLDKNVDGKEAVIDDSAHDLFVSDAKIKPIITDPTKQGPTIIFLPDAQVKPGVDLTYLRCQGEYIAHKKPDVIVCAGDFADMESLSSYDKGKKSAEGKRVAKDIEAAIAGMNALLNPVRKAQAQDPPWKPRMVLTLGNHECLKPGVEVLTRRGFVKITEVTNNDLIAQRGSDGKTVWGHLEGFVEKEYDGPMYNWSGQSLELSCTENHRVLRKTSGGNDVYSLAKDVPHHFEVYSATSNCSSGVSYSDAQISLGAWFCTDSHFSKYNQVVLYQRESNAHKIEQLLNTLGIKFKKSVRDRDIQEICGKVLKKRCEKSVEFFLDKSVAHSLSVFSNTRLPEWAWNLSEGQW
ncbi:MAG: metallophosphoesterase [Uliginosibacterium sp.]|nr:metallophosphoesterase [Uliginosibacterium sp.]